MAIKVECDRCHKGVKGVAHVRGFAIKREYCDPCVKKIDKMLKEIDDLHDWIAEQWEDKLLQIRENSNIEGGLLPDVSI